METEINLDATKLELFQAILEKSFDAIVIVDEKFCVQFWSRSAEMIFGYSADAAIGKRYVDLVTPPRQREKFESAHLDYISTGDVSRVGQNIEQPATHKSGEEIWVDVNWNAVTISGQRWAFAIIRDARNRRLREAKLQRAATTDPLSGLANRRQFQQKLESHLDQPLAVAIVDIDRFKTVNDVHGHLTGDQAISFISRNLLLGFPDALVIARLGGDEFGVVILSEDSTELMKSFETVRKAIEDGTFSDLSLRTSISVGIAFAKLGGQTAREMLTQADKALYASKEAGRNKVTLAQVE